MAEPLSVFLSVFDCGAREQRDARVHLFQRWDPNGNGYLSFSEVDSGIRNTLWGKLGTADGDALWHRYRHAYIRAFSDAKDAAPVESVKGVDTSDYVTFKEFRLLICYLKYYVTWFEVFSLVDGHSKGTTAADDRRISEEEWVTALDQVREAGQSWAPYVALKNARPESFAEMDANGKGMVLLIEFCKWVEKGEIEAKTEAGANLAIGEGDEK